MKELKRITLNPKVMGGKPCIRGLRGTVDTVVGLLATGYDLDFGTALALTQAESPSVIQVRTQDVPPGRLGCLASL